MKHLLLISLLFSQLIAKDLVVYSARNEQLIQPLFELFEKETGTKVSFLTGKAGPLFQKLKAEGKRSPADIFLTVDAGNLWQAAEAGLFTETHSKVLSEKVPKAYQDPKARWFGFSLRSRTLVYHTDRVKEADLESYEAMADSKWKSRLVLRTSKKVYNQSLTATLIDRIGEDKTLATLNGWVKNLATPPTSNDTKALQSLLDGKGDVALVNTYYFGRLLKKKGPLPLKIFWPNQKTSVVHVNISGAGILKSSKNKKVALEFLEWLTTPNAQTILSNSNMEYPVIEGIELHPIVRTWGDFKVDEQPIYKAGTNQRKAVILMQRAGWK